MTTPGIAGVVGVVMFIAGWWGGAEWQQRRSTPIAAKQPPRVETNTPCQAIWVDRSSPDVWVRWIYVTTTSGKVIGEVSRGPGEGTSLAIRRDGSMLNQYLNLDAAKKGIEDDEAVKKECR